MPINANDLPAEIRAKLGLSGKGSKSRKGRAAVEKGFQTYRCCSCGFTDTNIDRLCAKHIDPVHGSARVEAVT